MKRETLRHPKTLDLAARLGVDRPTALGILTLLWDFTAEIAIQGDVGKWPNGAIARACDYMGDHDAFIRNLIDARWLDEHPEHRLIIHDWPDHCERWVKAKLKALELNFLSCYGSIGKSTGPTVGDAIGPSPPRDRTEPNRTEPNQTLPAGRLDGRAATVDGNKISVDGGLWEEASPTMQRIASIVEPGRKLKAKDRELTAKAAVIAMRWFGMPWLEIVLKDIKDRSTPPEKPWGYFKGALTKSAHRLGFDFHEALRSVELPEPSANGARASP